MVLAVPVTAQRGRKVSKNMQAVVQGNNQFSLDLYHHLAKDDGNLFFSPYSISNALAMTYAGARGETAGQMSDTLNFPFSQDKFHPAFGELVKHLNVGDSKRKYKLNVANALWGQKGYAFLPDFLNLNKNHYGAEVRELNFYKNTEGARKTINDWVENATNKKIKDLIPQGNLAKDTRLVLTNAIYFKAGWMLAFPKQGTKEEVFHAPSGKVKVPMMHKSEPVQYYGGKFFQAVSLPYDWRQLSMVIVLPKKGHSLSQVEKQLNSETFSALLKKMKTYQVDTKLPKFKITYKIKLKKTLSEMGMPLAFSKNADFSGMTTQEKLFIDQVIHKAYVNVHEKGTEAAAATAVLIRPTVSLPNYQKATFHADRPFIILIRENQTGSILFMGRVLNPKG